MSLVESTPLAGAALANVTTWTDERIAELKRLWTEGLSASRIAAELGGLGYCTDGGRSAVIGKAHRLNLEARGRDSGNRPTKRPKPKPRTRHIVTHLRKVRAEAKERPAKEAVPEATPVVFSATPCSLLELTDDTCRWPIGDPGTPEFAFCGGMARHGAPYCGCHMRIAYTPHAAAKPRAERTETGWG